jgi:hypothetical protein
VTADANKKLNSLEQKTELLLKEIAMLELYLMHTNMPSTHPHPPSTSKPPPLNSPFQKIPPIQTCIKKVLHPITNKTLLSSMRSTKATTQNKTKNS